jgi:hypothetical protein
MKRHSQTTTYRSEAEICGRPHGLAEHVKCEPGAGRAGERAPRIGNCWSRLSTIATLTCRANGPNSCFDTMSRANA